MTYTIYRFLILIGRIFSSIRFLTNIIAVWFYKLFRSNKTFRFQNRNYPYFYHIYNNTIAGERIVEVPLIKGFLDDYKGQRILEIGNVLSHYFRVGHDILDKYEHGKHIINKDIVGFRPNHPYDLIISISTLEHIGYEYGEQYDPKKILRVIAHTKTLLCRGGLFVATLPYGYNTFVTRLIQKNTLPFDKLIYLKRISYAGEWRVTTRLGAIRSGLYDSHYANAQAVCVGIYKKKSR